MDPVTTPCTNAGRPSWTLLGIEPLRAALEYIGMHLMSEADLADGDGHPVVVFPGLATDERAVAPLVAFCERRGYATYDWGRGMNTGPAGDADAWIRDLATHVQSLVAAHEQRASLVGWSLGGIYAREVAKLLPGKVRQVITIGTPFAGTPGQNNVGLLYRLLNGAPLATEEALLQRLAAPPSVPTTSIYSRTDGVVAWQACVQPGLHAQVENIEVEGSHCGLGWNPAVLRVVADRLREPDGAWRRYSAARSPAHRASGFGIGAALPSASE